jgi:hypothetical protein
MIVPCKCCTHNSRGLGSAMCRRCKWAWTDQFAPSRLCVTCRFDPRLHAVCARCVDHDQWTERQPTACTLCHGALYIDGVGGSNGWHPCPMCALKAKEVAP